MLHVIPLLPWLLPGIYLIGALLAVSSTRLCWCVAAIATRCALAATIISGVLELWGEPASSRAPAAGAAALVALLIAFLGWIIGDHARRYLRGEPGRQRFTVAYLATLTSVSTVVVSEHLALIIGAWSASSIGLHHLLTFYRDRPAAIIVAHKKFLASRLAEVCLVAAAVLLFHQWRTLDLGAISALAGASDRLPPFAGMAAALIAVAVLLKSAQLPLHGWLIQVMEAPTPVSALLHAGVVNLGGYVLIRLAALIAAAPVAQTILVIVGSLTAALAGLVMLTRITIKVRLAWSTVSQMGFMVMECGLGLYDLALLHLLAHSLYKAHAFLTSGETVGDSVARQIIASASPEARRPGTAGIALALSAALLVTAGSNSLWHHAFGMPAIPWIALAFLACGLATLLWSPSATMRPTLAALGGSILVVQLYLGWHGLLSAHPGISSVPPHALLAGWTLLVFTALYAAQARLLALRGGASHGRLYDWVYAGFYLDERFTRLTFRLWPVKALPGTENTT